MATELIDIPTPTIESRRREILERWGETVPASVIPIYIGGGHYTLCDGHSHIARVIWPDGERGVQTVCRCFCRR